MNSNEMDLAMDLLLDTADGRSNARGIPLADFECPRCHQIGKWCKCSSEKLARWKKRQEELERLTGY